MYVCCYVFVVAVVGTVVAAGVRRQGESSFNCVTESGAGIGGGVALTLRQSDTSSALLVRAICGDGCC